MWEGNSVPEKRAVSGQKPDQIWLPDHLTGKLKKIGEPFIDFLALEVTSGTQSNPAKD